jgi:FkbH-like protein
MSLERKVRFAFVPTWVWPSYDKGLGMLDMKSGGIANVLMRMNLRLADNLDKAPNIHLLNAGKWIETAGQGAFHPKLWYMGKIPFANDVFKEAVKDVKSSLNAISGLSKKLVIVDLDDTLWGGVVGEIGWKSLRLGGHDPIGEAYVDFQRALKSLTNRGILLGIVSKNEESIALEAIEKNPEMVLRLPDFAGWKINWSDKAQNVIDLVSDLNLGLEAAVFIDDNPVERARVQEALPQVFVPHWPDDRMLYKKALLSLACFNSASITEEDLGRTKMYVSERERLNLRKTVGSLDDWLKSLGTHVRIEEVNEVNLQRVVQLFNKTNQMNLSTRRMAESELLAWSRQDGHKLWTFRVADKFGDAGLTGIISLEIANNQGKIADFILSCRVMGRKVEELMLYTVIEFAESAGLKEVWAQYIPTPSNKPCLEFWKRAGFDFGEEEHMFRWRRGSYPLPDAIQIDADTL